MYAHIYVYKYYEMHREKKRFETLAFGPICDKFGKHRTFKHQQLQNISKTYNLLKFRIYYEIFGVQHPKFNPVFFMATASVKPPKPENA